MCGVTCWQPHAAQAGLRTGSWLRCAPPHAGGGNATVAAAAAAPLLAFRATFPNGASALPDWSNATSPCRWEGVICSGGQVVELRLADKGLRGPLAPQDWALPETILKINLGGKADCPA